MPDVGIQVPPNLADWWDELVRGRRDRPRRAVGQRRPHLSRARLPEPAPGPQAPSAAGLRADRAALRLPAVPRSGVDGAGRPRRGQAQVLELHPAQGLGPPHRAGDRPGRSRPRAIEQGAPGRGADRGGADRAVRRDAPGGDRGDARGGRRAARRAGGRARHLRRQPQHQLHQRLHGRLRVLRLRPGPALARRLPRRPRTISRRGSRRRSSSAPPRSACRAASIPTTRSSTTARWLRLAKEVAPQIHLHAYSPMEIHFMCERSGKSPEAVFDYLLECGPRLDARDRGGGARRRRPAADLAEQAPGRPLGGDHRGLPPLRACARPRP